MSDQTGVRKKTAHDEPEGADAVPPSIATMLAVLSAKVQNNVFAPPGESETENTRRFIDGVLRLPHIADRTLRDSLIAACTKVTSCTVVDYHAAFARPLQAPELTRESLVAALAMLWSLSGPRAASAFFSSKPADEATARAVFSALTSLEPSFLGLKFHFSQVINGFNGRLNYEPIADFLMNAVEMLPQLVGASGANNTGNGTRNASNNAGNASNNAGNGSNNSSTTSDAKDSQKDSKPASDNNKDGKTVLSPEAELAAVVLAYVGHYHGDKPASKLEPKLLTALQASAATLVNSTNAASAPIVGSVFENLGSAKFSYAIFERVLSSPAFITAITTVSQDSATKLLKPWATEHESPHYTSLLSVLVRADQQSGSAFWSQLLTSLFGSDTKAYGALLDYMLKKRGSDEAGGNTESGNNGSNNGSSTSSNNSSNSSEGSSFSADSNRADGRADGNKTDSTKTDSNKADGKTGSNNDAAAAEESKSLRIIGAVAQLVQSVDPPKDRSDRIEQVQALQLQLIRDYPRLINYGQGYDAAILSNSGRPTFAKDVEDEMKLCFQKMYEQQHDIQEVIAMLEKLKHSEIPRDQDLFACMIHSLFDEYQFFPQYPVKALAATAVLFGSLVHFRLVEGVPLAIALKFVLDSLRQDVDSNMFRFGLQALVELRQRLEEFPKYCKVLLTIPGLRKQHQFYAQIKAIADPDSDDERLELFRSINFTADALEDEDANGSGPGKGKELDDALKRVSVLVNNLTGKNLTDKAQDAFREIEFIGATRFARILVARALNEANYHEIYASLIDLLPPEVGNFCINVITGNMARILNSGDALSSDKRLSLKNLGQFLGMLTVAKNRPLLFNQVHLKLLLAEGVRYEKLPAVLPAVAKIMMQTANSKVFYRTSPWVEGILGVLSELYTFGNLKLTMKFEIEVLGKAIGVNIPEMKPAVYIRDVTKQVEDLNSIATTFGGPAIGNSLLVSTAPLSLAAQQLASGILPGVNPSNAAALAAANAPGGIGVAGTTSDNRAIPGMPGMPDIPGANVPPGMAASTATGAPISGAAAALFGGVPTVGGAVGSAAVGGALGTTPGAPGGTGVPLAGTTEFVTHPGLRQLLDMARSKTLVDVLLPVIDRAVSIASFTAKELVLKDLARESDEGMLQAAAHSQALVLASSMAIVTAKDPFIEALTHNLRSLMLAQGYGDAQVLLDQAQVAARETMESLVPLIESVAREKVIAEVDEALLQSYQARHLARAQNKPFEPEGFVESPIELPELLAVRKGGLLPEQMSVYDNFAQQAARVFQENTASAGGPPPDANVVTINNLMPGNPMGLLQNEIQQFTDVIRKLVELTKSEPVSQKRLGDLNKDDEVLVVLSNIVEIAHNGARHSEEMPLRSSHVVVQALFGPESTKSVLCRECLCYSLGELCRMSSVTAKEVVLWLLYADDPKKYNANVIGTLLRSRLVTPTEIDATLTKDLAEIGVKPGVLEYAVRLLLDALIGPEPYCLRSDFAGTILAISRLDAQKYPAAGILVTSLGETKGQGTGNEGHVFAEWTRLMQHHATASSPMLLHAFVRDLHSLGWGSNPDQLTKFICTAVSVSVQSYMQSRSFVGVDAVATLITTLLQTAKGSEELAQTLFTIITMLVAQNHENGFATMDEAVNGDSESNGNANSGTSANGANTAGKSEKEPNVNNTAFEPLVYYRLLSSIANSLPERFVGLFAQHVLVLQPLAFPGFASYWMTLMSHRFVMGRLLDNDWPALFSLMKALLTFLRHTWLSPAMAPNVKNFVYRGVERICLVVLHDAPEFFVRYADEITALLVFEFVQLRNLVLCAFPEGVSLPHPIEMKEADYPDAGDGIRASVEDARALLTERKVNKLVENACLPRPQLTPQIVMAIQTALAYSKPVEDRGVDFNSVNVSMLGYNSLCTYIAHLYTQSPPSSGKVEDSGAAQFCGRMLLTLSRENRYAFVSAIANHLRYPEKHTYFFSRFLLALFTPFGERMFKDGTVDARHVVTRVLLERLMAHRAHPWGLMATFAELLKSSQYNFWDMPFIKSSNELSELFSTLYTHISQSELQA